MNYNRIVSIISCYFSHDLNSNMAGKSYSIFVFIDQ